MNINNQLHMYILQYLFTPHIQQNLDRFRNPSLVCMIMNTFMYTDLLSDLEVLTICRIMPITEINEDILFMMVINFIDYVARHENVFEILDNNLEELRQIKFFNEGFNTELLDKYNEEISERKVNSEEEKMELQKEFFSKYCTNVFGRYLGPPV